jgi:ACR3 family arsenite transporter
MEQLETNEIILHEISNDNKDPLGIFGRYLTIWVLLCIIVGTTIGASEPKIAEVLNEVTISEINFIVTILIWIMIFPMMLQIDWNSLKYVKNHPKAIIICTFLNWVIQPFLTYAFALLFFRVIFKSLISNHKKDEFIAGSVILGGSPCTAMVFVWSQLAGGDPSYTLIQVALNDLIILILYTPTLILLIDASDIHIPYDTIFLSVFLFIVIPFTITYLLRFYMLKKNGKESTDKIIRNISKKCTPFTIIALLLTLILIFIFQGKKIYDHPIDIVLNIIPLTLVAIIIFIMAYFMCLYFKVPYKYAAPACFIATSNFFELAVAVALSAYGLDSGAVLTTVVGVLVEVPIMLIFVKIMIKTKNWYSSKLENYNIIS